ncbi:universal stress protein [Marinomonas piezotolerans]|uniref:Universal stress protein n=1 Tax=Marinomonas piezotolerans TaxID=2213058 RepID=A0A370U5K6_9GAMM|nr:universal stress protein [Marinomonas piezotolerans]RDL43064.1 universal stress protein [Marinomonas piezotolerans]
MLPKINTILYACDLEPKTNQAMEMVISLAISNQASVVLMHAMEPVSSQAANMIHNYVSDDVLKLMRKDAIETTHKRMEDLLQQFSDAHPDDMAKLKSAPTIEVVNGIAADVIEKTAEKTNADLIVMNSRTHSKIGQMVIGSTANKVVHRSHIPVLVVPILK